MAFCLDATNIPRLTNYAEALACYRQIKPWKNDSFYGSSRPLDRCNRKKRHVRITHKMDGSVACTLHMTDVVTYHPDNAITIRTYNSMSTDGFANALLPAGVHTQMNTAIGSIVWLRINQNSQFAWHGGWRGYLVADNATITQNDDGSWSISGSQPIKTYKLDKKKAAQARKEYRYSDFMAWRQAYLRMSVTTYDRNYPRSDILGCLQAGPESWEQIVMCDPPNILFAIYKREGCIIESEVEYIENYRDLQNISKGVRKYR